jgi:hypothetical protein
MYRESNCGPGFGGTSTDLLIYGNNQNCTHFPTSYIDTLGRGVATFTGAPYFTAEDYEVWAAAT